MSSGIIKLGRTIRHLGITCRYASTSSADHDTYDLVVVGGGIVGCATAREMLERHPNMKIVIVEKENKLAMHQTGHNSGVIHAGIYYTPGSIKAKLCVEGLKLSYDYFGKHNIPYKKVGKLIVAQDQEQAKRIDDLYQRGLKNNFEKMGGKVILNYEVTGFAENAESQDHKKFLPICVMSKNKMIHTKYVLTCAGLHSDRLAVMTGCDFSPRIIPFRGEYLLLDENKKHLCKTNIYPVPDPSLPFLGVHFTPRINGDIWLGPNAVLALAREGYRFVILSTWTDINIRDCIEMAKSPGLYKLCFRGPAGVRAQAMDDDGKLVDDFVFDNGVGSIGSRVLHCRNAPSPAATSSMAIAKHICNKLEKDFKF
ncbi:Similar to v1g172254: L-2-hydroxyglutarate dehydrogenase [Cotesia congregata]|uniref:L-2-hydroxyglutarate dehydrogenase, mitochondrial n=1 Tax=Cotesia congregata TaxID=51543 RepID=A0A8J2HUB4_COTCN|nr:Similar to v1g172254: L-2-hydroxyglutarate dehydrogenase [Cotesia congregata]